jgi:hypothetical protein
MVETMTISEVVMRVFDSAKPAKKKRAAMFGPSSMMPKLSVRKEFIADSAMASTMPAARHRRVGKACGGAASVIFRRGPTVAAVSRPVEGCPLLSRRTAVSARNPCDAFQRGTRSPPRSKVPRPGWSQCPGVVVVLLFVCGLAGINRTRRPER